MGVGIVSRYRYAFEGSAYKLKADIEKQIAAYLPELQGCQIDVSDKNGGYSINIIVDDVMYSFTFDTQAGTLTQLVNN